MRILSDASQTMKLAIAGLTSGGRQQHPSQSNIWHYQSVISMRKERAFLAGQHPLGEKRKIKKGGPLLLGFRRPYLRVGPLYVEWGAPL
jgi:hypothetical protein